MAIPYEPKPTENDSTSSTAGSDSPDSPSSPVSSSNQTVQENTETTDTEKTPNDQEPAERRTTTAASAEETETKPHPAERPQTETSRSQDSEEETAGRVQGDGTETAYSEKVTEGSQNPTDLTDTLSSTDAATPPVRSPTATEVSPVEEFRDLGKKKIGPKKEACTSKKTTAEVESQVYTESSDRALKNLATTAQLEQLAQELLNAAFQLTGCATMGAGKDTGVKDTDDNEVKKTDTMHAQAEDCEIQKTEPDNIRKALTSELEAESIMKKETEAERTAKGMKRVVHLEMTVGEAQPSDKAESGVKLTDYPGAIVQGDPTSKHLHIATSLGDAAIQVVIVPAAAETKPGHETSATTNTRPRVQSQTSTESSDMALTNLATTAQLEQLARGLVEAAFQLTTSNTEGTGKDSEVEVTELNSIEPHSTVVKETDVKETGVRDIDVHATEVKHTDVTDAEYAKLEDAEVKDTELNTGMNNEMNDKKMRNTEVKDCKVKDAEVKDTEVGTEVSDTEMKDGKERGVDVKDKEVNETEMKDVNAKTAEMNIEVKSLQDIETNEPTTETKNIIKFTETVARSTAECFEPISSAPQSENSSSESVFPIDKLPKCTFLSSGLDLPPKQPWPLSDRPWPWAATPRVWPQTQRSPDRSKTGVMYGALVDSNEGLVNEEDPLTSKPKGGARRKTRSARRNKGKSAQTVPPSPQLNGIATDEQTSENTRPAPGIVLFAAESRSSKKHPADTPHTKIDVGRLCCGYPSAEKLSAAVSTFQKQCAEVCKAQPPRERPFIDTEQHEYRGAEERKVLRGGAWWRRELQLRVRRPGRIGRWFDRRFERGVVLCDPPPLVKYTGFSTARASDFKSLDPKVFPRGSPVQLGQQWLPEGADADDRTSRTDTVASKFRQLNSKLTGMASVTEAGPSKNLLVNSEQISENNAVPKSTAVQDNDYKKSEARSPKDEQQNGEDAEVIPQEMNQKAETVCDDALLDDETRQVEMMENITDSWLRMGGSLADILNMVNNPQQVVREALAEGALISSEAAEEGENDKAQCLANQETTEETGGTRSETLIEDSIDEAEDIVSYSAVSSEETEGVTGRPMSAVKRATDSIHDAASVTRETQDSDEKTEDTSVTTECTARKTEGVVDMPECATECLESTTEKAENATKETEEPENIAEPEGAVGGPVTLADDRAELEVVEAIAMELDHNHVFTSNEPDYYESRLSDIDAKMRRVRERSDFIQQEYARVTKDVDSIKRTLPEMDDVFASLKNFSAAVLSGVRAKGKTNRKPFPGGELPELAFQQTNSSEKTQRKSTKRKSDGQKRSEDPGHTRIHNQQSKEKGDHSDRIGTKSITVNIAKPSPDSVSVEENGNNSTSNKPDNKSPTRPHVELAAADSTTDPPEPPSADHPTDSEYPRVMDSKELLPVAGLPPPGEYVAQHIHLLQPSEEDIAKSETGEERTSILSPIGRLAWALPHRFMSSKQLLEVHSLLRSENGEGEPRPMDTLRWVQDAGGQHLQTIHRFFQFGCDRRYHHVKLKGKPVALNKISSCGMEEYLRVKQWRWPALVSPNTFVSGRGNGDGVAPNPYRTNAEIENHMKEGDLLRVSGITGYIREVVRHICERLVSRLERRTVTCAQERDTVASLITVLVHRWNEATSEPAGIVLLYSVDNDSLLEGELRHTNRFVKLRCENHSVPIGCPSWSCQLWLWLLHETCRLMLEGEHLYIQSLQDQRQAHPPSGETPPPPYQRPTPRGKRKGRSRK